MDKEYAEKHGDINPYKCVVTGPYLKDQFHEYTRVLKKYVKRTERKSLNQNNWKHQTCKSRKSSKRW